MKKGLAPTPSYPNPQTKSEPQEGNASQEKRERNFPPRFMTCEAGVAWVGLALCPAAPTGLALLCAQEWAGNGWV